MFLLSLPSHLHPAGDICGQGQVRGGRSIQIVFSPFYELLVPNLSPRVMLRISCKEEAGDHFRCSFDVSREKGTKNLCEVRRQTRLPGGRLLPPSSVAFSLPPFPDPDEEIIVGAAEDGWDEGRRESGWRNFLLLSRRRHSSSAFSSSVRMRSTRPTRPCSSFHPIFLPPPPHVICVGTCENPTQSILLLLPGI